MENQSPITFSFSLPVGLLDNQDRRHRDGEMRLATGKDELYQSDPRSLENPAYGTLILLSRVIVQLGELSPVTPEDLEALFLTDWQYLQEVYNAINPQNQQFLPRGSYRLPPRGVISGGSLYCISLSLVTGRNSEFRSSRTTTLGSGNCLFS